VYSAGESEQIVAKALSGGRRDDVILATKCHFPVATGPFAKDRTPNTYGSSRRYIIKACEDSLRRLGTDWIDLYQMHRPDYTTDVDETLGALSDLIHQGKVRAIGSSTFPAELIVEAQWTAERRGRERFRCEQPPYSIFVRTIERDLLPVCQRYGMGAIVWSPLNGGWLSGKYRRDSDAEAFTTGRARRMPERFDPSVPGNERKLELVEELEKLAGEAGMTLAHLAIAWTLEHPGVTSTIIGPRTMEQLEGVLGADERRVPPELLDRIDELVPPGTAVRASEDPFQPPWIADASMRRRPS
jgi:aryl-alcohol dehydrogenase-like predicted oxidoreductase